MSRRTNKGWEKVEQHPGADVVQAGVATAPDDAPSVAPSDAVLADEVLGENPSSVEAASDASPAVQLAPGAIGWPVNFCMHNGELVPASLQRRNLITPGLWDLKITLPGALSMSSRAGVQYSPEPRPGYWSFIPGLEPRPRE